MEKTFAGGCKIAKFVKIFSFESFPLYSSLHSTAPTEIFRCGAPEKLIQELTGHCSIEALRNYERLDEVQHKAVSTMLSNTPGTRCTIYDLQHLMTSKTL